MKNIIFLSSFLCLIMACGKEGPPGPKGPDGAPYTLPPGNITGYIELRNQFGIVTDGIDSVLLQTYNADSIFSTYTNTNGYFNFEDVPPGNYDISITKPGYDSLHMYVRHAGGEIDKFTGVTSMSQHVNTTLVSLNGTHSIQSSSVRVDVELLFKWPAPPSLAVSGFKVFLDTSAVPGLGRTLANFNLISITDVDGVNGKLTGRFWLSPAQIITVSDFHLTAIVVPPTSVLNSWFDYTTGSQVPYPYLGDSIKTSITYTEE